MLKRISSCLSRLEDAIDFILGLYLLICICIVGSFAAAMPYMMFLWIVLMAVKLRRVERKIDSLLEDEDETENELVLPKRQFNPNSPDVFGGLLADLNSSESSYDRHIPPKDF